MHQKAVAQYRAGQTTICGAAIQSGAKEEAQKSHRIIFGVQTNGQVLMAGLKPTMISRFFPQVSQAQALEAERDIIAIVDNAR